MSHLPQIVRVAVKLCWQLRGAAKFMPCPTHTHTHTLGGVVTHVVCVCVCVCAVGVNGTTFDCELK